MDSDEDKVLELVNGEFLYLSKVNSFVMFWCVLVGYLKGVDVEDNGSHQLFLVLSGLYNWLASPCRKRYLRWFFSLGPTTMYCLSIRHLERMSTRINSWICLSGKTKIAGRVWMDSNDTRRVRDW